MLRNDIFLVFGVPQIIIFDNGKQFVSWSCKDLCSKYGVTLGYDANYHAQANYIERVNRLVKTMLVTYVEENHRSWDRHLAHVDSAIFTAKHDVRGHTPFLIDIGRNAMLMLMVKIINRSLTRIMWFWSN